MLRPALLCLFFVSAAYGTSCGTGSFSDTDRDGIVNNHNTLRSKIALGKYVAKNVIKPPATNMQKMSWDCAIEASAQKFANTCPTGHSKTPGLGENLYWSFSSAPLKINGMGVVASNAWQSEFQKYGWASNNLTVELFDSGIGHATQMSWWNSNKIGCGVMLCPSRMDGYKYEVAVVCQYKLPGNYDNQNIYNSGTTCSQCAAGIACEKATGLCV